MNQTKTDITPRFNQWLDAWNNYDLDGVLDFMHDDIIFENWDGSIISGKTSLKSAWSLWFRHQNFKFSLEDLCFDEGKQIITFAWSLNWPSLEKNYFGKKEIRQGVDILFLVDGKIYRKNTYSKTTFKLESALVRTSAI